MAQRVDFVSILLLDNILFVHAEQSELKLIRLSDTLISLDRWHGRPSLICNCMLSNNM